MSGFDEYYYIYERLTESRKKLQDYIQVIDNALRMVEEDKNHVIQHALEHGKKLYQEMQRISKSSYVRLEGRKTPKQMLLINIPEELGNHCEERIREHIEYCVEALRKDCDASENMEETVRKKVQVLLTIPLERPRHLIYLMY